MPKFKVNDSTNNPVRIGDTVDLTKINVKTPNDPYVRRSELKSELNILRVELNDRIDKLENKMDAKFNDLNTKFNNLNTKFEELKDLIHELKKNIINKK